MSRSRDLWKRLGNTLLNGLTGTSAPRGSLRSTDWLADCPAGAELLSWGSDERVELPPRPSLGASSSALESVTFGGDRSFTAPAEFVLVLRGGRVFGREGAIITPDNWFLRDLSMSTGGSEDKVTRRGPLPRPRELHEPLGVLAHPQCGDFYHWMIAGLPNLGLLEQAGLGASPLFAPTKHAFHRHSLEIMGVESSRVLPATRLGHVRSSRLFAPTNRGHFLTPGARDWLRGRFLPAALGGRRAQSGRRLYITRRRASIRRVLNESSLSPLLAERGFEVLELEGLALSEQVRAFAEASHIVAPHGAGLSHLVFCEPGTRVLELGTPLRQEPYFHAIAALCGLRYLQVIGSPAGRRIGSHDSDLDVRLESVEAGLDWLEVEASGEGPRASC